MNKSHSPFLFGVSAAFALALLTSPSQVHAFGGPPGGPFSNGSYFPNDGTFSAVVRGTNLTGTLQFSTTSDAGPSAPSPSIPAPAAGAGGTAGSAALPQSTSGGGGLGSTGVSTIYYDGDTYLGNSQGAYNPEDSSMTVSFQADAEGQGNQTFTVTTPITTFGTSTTNGVVTNTEQTTFQPVRTVVYYDSLYFNGVAECETTNAFPNQKFKGKGEAEFQHLVFTGITPFLDAVTMPISVSGVRLANTAAAFATQNVRPPSVNEYSVFDSAPVP